ncbi:MAG: hypothetical protein HY363_03230 [Candidatus Aenigmarchaeota archaeon]|nr:hypothetical protein [Candidatus Aenigmarchaeota archaeon]
MAVKEWLRQKATDISGTLALEPAYAAVKRGLNSAWSGIKASPSVAAGTAVAGGAAVGGAVGAAANAVRQRTESAQAETRIQIAPWETHHTSRLVSGIISVIILAVLSRFVFPLFGYPSNYWLVVFVLGSFLAWAYTDYVRTGTLLSRHYYGLTIVILLLTFFFALINIGLILFLGLTILHIVWRLTEGRGIPAFDVLLAGALLGIIGYFLLNSPVVGVIVFLVAVTGVFLPTFSVTLLMFLATMIGTLVLFQRLPSSSLTVVAPIILLGLFVMAFVLIEQNRAAGIFSLLILITVTISLFWFGGIPGVERESVIGQGAKVMKESILQIPQSARVAMRNLQKSYERDVAYAKGDYAASQIDEDSKRDLGVQLEELKASEERTFEGMPASFYTTLKAEALDKPINIIASCTIDEQNIELLGCETKEGENCKITVEGKETTNLDCVAENLPAGTHTATLSANFDFTTRSYLPVYLMEKNKLRELIKRNLDPLKGYDIKEPVATTTKGPVRVGIAVGAQPVGIGLQTGEPGPTIAVTIDNTWEGEVKEIKNVLIFLPKGIRITKIAGARVLGIPFKQTCDGVRQIDEQEARLCDETINAYTITPESADEAFGSFVSFRAYTLTGEGLELGPAPITTRNIRVSVIYEYSLEKEKIFTVEQPMRSESEQDIQTVTVASHAEQEASDRDE